MMGRETFFFSTFFSHFSLRMTNVRFLFFRSNDEDLLMNFFMFDGFNFSLWWEVCFVAVIFSFGCWFFQQSNWYSFFTTIFKIQLLKNLFHQKWEKTKFIRPRLLHLRHLQSIEQWFNFNANLFDKWINNRRCTIKNYLFHNAHDIFFLFKFTRVLFIWENSSKC